jgi:glycosyltransferase involved in cell wall biosynthesis
MRNAESGNSEALKYRNTETTFLQLLGAMDEHSPEVIELGVQKLGAGNFAAKSVRPEQVADYYRAADIFVLGSLKEGFGRVYLEALMHGLPTIGHRHPVIEYVLGDVGIVADLAKPGELAELLFGLVIGGQVTSDKNEPVRRLENVRSRFSWEVLRPQYAEMFRRAAAAPLKW